MGQVEWVSEMSPGFKIFDPPALINSESFLSDWPDETGQYRQFFEFEWHGEPYWLTGYLNQSGPIHCGRVLIIPKGKRKPIPCRLLINTGYEGLRFRIERPAKLPKVGPTEFFFVGFDNSSRLERGFLQAEERRIEALFVMKHKGDLTLMARPPSGLVI